MVGLGPGSFFTPIYMYKLSALLVLLFSSLAPATAQDNIFSQYYAMPLTVNVLFTTIMATSMPFVGRG